MNSYVCAPLSAAVPRPAMVSKSRLVPNPVRRQRRHFVKLEGQVVREDDFRQVGTSILNLSELGMFVSTSVEVAVGDSMIVAFMAPFTRTWIDAEAIVTRVALGRRKADRMLGAGLEFLEIGAASRALLREQLQGLPPPLPTRR